MITRLETDRAGVVAFDMTDMLTDADYKTVLVPSIEEHLKSVDQAHLLLRFGPDFQGYTAHAMVDDGLLGLRHLHDFERVAVVSDHAWLNSAIRMFGPLMPAQIKVFSIDDMEEAKTWVAW